MSPFAVLAVTLALGLLSARWLQRYAVTLPMAFVIAGLVLGNHGLGWLDLTPTAELTKEVVGITLGILLFAEASQLDLRRVVAEANLEGRLVSICVLASVGIGGGMAWLLFPGEELGVVLLIGAALAPTDAALSVGFNANRSIPGRIRHALHVESGLSDGVVAPFVALFIPLAIAGSTRVDGGWLAEEVEQLLSAIAIGAIAGAAGGWLIREARSRAWTTNEMSQIAFVALALGTFFSSGNWDGNRYIAAFVGGLVAGTILRRDAHAVTRYAEETGAALSFLVWIIFGAVLVPLAFGSLFSWNAVAFALLALAAMRMVAVAVALAGFGMRRDTIALMGWFGPRGLPSVAFLVTALVAFAGAGAPAGTLIAAMTWTIMLSVFLHGVSAFALSNWYVQRLSKADHSIPELEHDLSADTAH